MPDGMDMGYGPAAQNSLLAMLAALQSGGTIPPGLPPTSTPSPSAPAPSTPWSTQQPQQMWKNPSGNVAMEDLITRTLREYASQNRVKQYQAPPQTPTWGSVPQAPTWPSQAQQQQPTPQAGPPKAQDRMMQEGGFTPGRGDMWAPPTAQAGGASGGGVSPGGSAPPSATAPTGPMTWQQVVQAIWKSNPELAKRKDGKAIVAMAAMQYMPLMQHQSQQEMKQLEFMLKLQMQRERMDMSESRLGLAEERLNLQRERVEGRTAGVSADEKEYDKAATEYRHAATALSNKPADKNLQKTLERAQTRLDEIDAKRNPEQAQAKATAKIVEGKTPAQVISALPQELTGKLSASEREQFADMLIAEPLKAQAAINALARRLRTRSTTEVPKSDGYYR